MNTPSDPSAFQDQFALFVGFDWASDHHDLVGVNRQGQILLDNIELNRYPRRYLRQHIGIVEQEPFLFSRSIRENITYGVGRKVPQAEIESASGNKWGESSAPSLS